MYFKGEINMKSILLVMIIVVVLCMIKLLVERHRIKIWFKKLTKRDSMNTNLFYRIHRKRGIHKLRYYEKKYYSKIYNEFKDEMKCRAENGDDMNEEFGREIARLKAQMNSENDILAIIGFTLAGISFLQNIGNLFQATSKSSNSQWLIAINFIALMICILIAVFHKSGEEIDKKCIVCIEILERLEKSNEFYRDKEKP